MTQYKATEQQSWLYNVGLIESLCFSLTNKKIYWYKSLVSNRFAYSFIGGYQPGFEKCKDPT